MSKPIEELTFSDNFMFGAVLSRNLGLCKEILELILERKISSISFSNPEQYLEAAPDSKAVRLDVYLEDDTSKVWVSECIRIALGNPPSADRRLKPPAKYGYRFFDKNRYPVRFRDAGLRRT